MNKYIKTDTFETSDKYSETEGLCIFFPADFANAIVEVQRNDANNVPGKTF